MGDYTSPVDQVNAEAYNPSTQTSKLAEMLQKRSLQTQSEQSQKELVKLAAMLKQQGSEADLQRTLAAYKDLSSKNPNAAITLDGLRVDTMGPAEKTAGEAKNIYGEMDRQTKDDKDTLDTVHRLDEMFKNPTKLDPGVVQSELARAAVKGRIPLQEYNRVFPTSLKQDIGKVGTYISPALGGAFNSLVGNDSNQSLNDEQVQFAHKFTNDMRNAAQGHIKNVRDELSRGMPQLAPMMQHQGTAQPFVNNMGSAYLQPQQQAPQSGGMQQPAPAPVDKAARLKYLQDKKNGLVD